MTKAQRDKLKQDVGRVYRRVRAGTECTADDVVCNPQLRKEFLRAVHPEGWINPGLECETLKVLLGLRKSGKLAPEGKAKAYAEEEGSEVE